MIKVARVFSVQRWRLRKRDRRPKSRPNAKRLLAVPGNNFEYAHDEPGAIDDH